VGVLLEQTLPDAVAAMLAAPLVLVVSILIMSTAGRPMRNTLLFVAGAAVLDLCLAFLFLTLYGDVGLSSSNINYGAWIDTVVGVALLVFGIRAGLARRTPADSEAEDARFDKIARSNAKGLLLAGLAAQIINIDALVIMAGGMKEIAMTNPLPTQLEIALAVLIFVYVMLMPYHLAHRASARRAGTGRRVHDGGQRLSHTPRAHARNRDRCAPGSAVPAERPAGASELNGRQGLTAGVLLSTW